MIGIPTAVDVAALKDTTLLNMGIFGIFVAVTMVIVLRASRNNKTAADYYAAGRSFTGSQNGTAIAGDYLSAASFLGITGAIAINGYDGFMYSIGFLVAWLVSLLLGISDWGGQALVIIVVGGLMIMYVLIGGMKGTTWVQIIKAVLLIAGAAVMTVMVFAKFGFDFSEILGSAQNAVSDSAS